MTQRTKTYVAFDGDVDLTTFQSLEKWSQDKDYPFDLIFARNINYSQESSLPQSIINQLEKKLDSCKNFILIIGSKTNNMRKTIIQYEIRYALQNKLPIFIVYKDYSSDDWYSKEFWINTLRPMIPKLLREDWTQDKYCLVCPFSSDVLFKAIIDYTNNDLPGEGYTWYWEA